MTNFLFWNTNRKDITGTVVDTAREHRVDVLILAESSIHPAALLAALNADTTNFHFVNGLSRSISVYTRFSRSFVKNRRESDRYSIRELRLPGMMSILLAMVHLPSKLYWSEDSQAQECGILSRIIREEEQKAGHNRTVLVGDFNMNPFEKGVVGAAGLNATMHREVAGRQYRTVQRESYPFFYNPMWNHFGDDRQPASGTYYYERSEHVSFFWNIFDQIMVRPELIGRLPKGDVRILTEVNGTSLLSKGRPESLPEIPLKVSDPRNHRLSNSGLFSNRFL